MVRRGRGGAIREHGEGFVAAAFRHRTSRAQDPHLHTHVIVANLAALAGRRVAGARRRGDPAHLPPGGRLPLRGPPAPRAVAPASASRWTEPVKGMAEIEGVPEEAIRAFSTRRQSLVEHMEAMGTSGFAASRVAALATRERKEAVDLPDLRESWLARASEMGLGAIELRGLLDARAGRASVSCRRSPPTTSPPTRRPSPRPSSSAPSPAPRATGRAWRRSWPASRRSRAGPSSPRSATTRRPGGRRASRRGASSSSSARRCGSRSPAATRAPRAPTPRAWRWP